MDIQPSPIDTAVKHLQQGGVIAYPTEGVWGIGCDPDNKQAVERLLAIKQRPVEKGLILVAASLDQFAPLLQELTSEQQQLLTQSWPGPNTWLIPLSTRWTTNPTELGDGSSGIVSGGSASSGSVPPWIRGQHQQVALRVSDHPLVQSLCRAFGGPLVSTSANKSGQTVAEGPEQIRQQLPELDFIVPGELGGRKQASTIRDIRTGQVVRA